MAISRLCFWSAGIIGVATRLIFGFLILFCIYPRFEQVHCSCSAEKKQVGDGEQGGGREAQAWLGDG